MLHALAKHWWALALRGVVAILLGLFTILVPGITMVYLVLAFGAYALLDGVFNILACLRARGQHWALLIEGLIGIAAGVLTFAWPGITAMVLLYVIAFWAIFTGVMEVIAGIRLREVIEHEWWLILMGIASLLFGLLILIAPGTGALAIVIWIGAYALIFGIMLLALAFRLRGLSHDLAGSSPLPRAA